MSGVGMGVGVEVGIAVGVAFGIAIGNIASGVVLGVVLELARIGSLHFMFIDSTNDQIGFSWPLDTFATHLSA